MSIILKPFHKFNKLLILVGNYLLGVFMSLNKFKCKKLRHISIGRHKLLSVFDGIRDHLPAIKAPLET